MTDNELIFLIGEERSYRVKEALLRTFGQDDLSSLALHHTGTASSHQFLYRLGSAGVAEEATPTAIQQRTQFFVRIVKQVTILNEPYRQFYCAETASKEELTPRILYADPEDHILIGEYIEPQQLPKKITSGNEFYREFAKRLRTLHHGPAFPPAPEVYDVMEGLMQSLQQRHTVFPGVVSHYFSYIGPIRRVMQFHRLTAPCHNDLNPRNVLYDGARLWFTEWEAASQFDPYFDLATVANYFIYGYTKLEVFLTEYFGREATDEERAKLFLMQQLSFCYYALLFLHGAVKAGVAPLTEEEIALLPDYHFVQQRIASGVMRLSTPSDLQKLAVIFVKESLRAVTTSQYTHALELLDAKRLYRPMERLDQPKDLS